MNIFFILMNHNDPNFLLVFWRGSFKWFKRFKHLQIAKQRKKHRSASARRPEQKASRIRLGARRGRSRHSRVWWRMQDCREGQSRPQKAQRELSQRVLRAGLAGCVTASTEASAGGSAPSVSVDALCSGGGCQRTNGCRRPALKRDARRADERTGESDSLLRVGRCSAAAARSSSCACVRRSSSCACVRRSSTQQGAEGAAAFPWHWWRDSIR